MCIRDRLWMAFGLCEFEVRLIGTVMNGIRSVWVWGTVDWHCYEWHLVCVSLRYGWLALLWMAFGLREFEVRLIGTVMNDIWSVWVWGTVDWHCYEWHLVCVHRTKQLEEHLAVKTHWSDCLWAVVKLETLKSIFYYETLVLSGNVHRTFCILPYYYYLLLRP